MSKKAGLSIEEVVQQFIAVAQPLEGKEKLIRLIDNRKGATYCECHLKASKLVALATTDAPLDPEEQGEYRANREIVENSPAFETMKDDATKRRSFSNIVAEYMVESEPDRPIKIIGGQHRYQAISEALDKGVDEYHGVKLYFGLDTDQRLDVQLISNTNIAVSADLYDRMQETAHGPELRNWCQDVGFLPPNTDFADKRGRGNAMTVHMARTFITNYFLGKKVPPAQFDTTPTVPELCPTGQHDPKWEELKKAHKSLWTDKNLREAAKQFATLISAQRSAFTGRKVKPDYPEKGLNLAVLSAWAYVAGMLQDNDVRLKRHYALAGSAGKDPLNAAELAKGRHKSDPENYRGLGYRTDFKERGRFVELFFHQAEKSGGITRNAVDIAIKQYHAKQAQLEVIKAKGQESAGD